MADIAGPDKADRPIHRSWIGHDPGWKLFAPSARGLGIDFGSMGAVCRQVRRFVFAGVSMLVVPVVLALPANAAAITSVT